MSDHELSELMDDAQEAEAARADEWFMDRCERMDLCVPRRVVEQMGEV